LILVALAEGCMSDDGGETTETVQVKTRIPKYQKSEWSAAADRLGMSQSEFVRTMVQAGRRGFEGAESGGVSSNPAEAPPEATDPRGSGLETRVRSALAEADVMSWDQLVEALSGDFEDRLEEAIADLESAGQIRYSPRDGGYVLTDGE
jgi:hypothetical protein